MTSGEHLQANGIVIIDVPAETSSTTATSFSVGAASGPLGSVVHGTRIEVNFLVDNTPTVKISMGAADALQLAEEIRGAVHRRDDVKRA